MELMARVARVGEGDGLAVRAHGVAQDHVARFQLPPGGCDSPAVRKQNACAITAGYRDFGSAVWMLHPRALHGSESARADENQDRSGDRNTFHTPPPSFR